MPVSPRYLGVIAMFVLADAQAGYLDSFRDASKSSVDYRRAVATPQVDCRTLRQITDYNISVISAEAVVSNGSVPEHCRIHGVIQPEVQFWVYLPRSWNGRIYMAGHSGYAGASPDDLPVFSVTIPAGVANNFATVFTNTGHDSAYQPYGTFAHNELKKTVDYSYRAVHLTIRAAKELVRQYYGQAATKAYWDGCSTGGRQGLMEAQRFPEDFDGIVAGAPVNDQTNLHIWMAWVFQSLEQTPIPPAKVVKLLAPRVYEKCDAVDGLKDGLIQDPLRCRFAPASDLPICRADDRDDCFTGAQIDTLTRIYSPVMSNGSEYFPALQLGAEPVGAFESRFAPLGASGSGWLAYPGLIDAAGKPGRMVLFADTFFKYFAFRKDDPNYHWRSLDFDRDLRRIEDIRKSLDAVDPDLSAFRARGGKMIQYHGWADTGPPASFSVKYYDEVLGTMGSEQTQDFYRLFMVPGMFHCNGGFGPDVFDAMTSLIEWVEGGKPPDDMVAFQLNEGKLSRSRPLCSYPQIAQYKGSGDVSKASSFACSNPRAENSR